MVKNENKLIGVVGDLHFFPSVDNTDKWEQVYDELGDWIVSEYTKRGIKTIIFLGDLFEGRIQLKKEKGADFRTYTHLVKFLRKFDDFELAILVGNHDCFYKNTSDNHGLKAFEKWDNIMLVDEKPEFIYYTQCSEPVMGDTDDHIPFSKLALVPWGTELKDIPKADTIFGHFDIKTFKYNAHKTSEHGFKSEQLFRCSSNIISGHYHHHQVRKYKKGDIMYVGTPLQVNWGEANKDSYVMVFDCHENQITEKIENTISPKHLRLPLTGILGDKSILNGLGNSFLKIDVDKDIDKEKLTKLSSILTKKNGVREIDMIHQSTEKFDEDYQDVAFSVDYEETMISFIEEKIEDPKEIVILAKEYYDKS